KNYAYICKPTIISLAEAIATACFIQNRSIIHKHFDKTPYELINKRKPNIKFFRVFGCRCYLLNDYEDVGKLKAKGDIGVSVGYSKESAAFRIYNKRTRKIHESVNVNFNVISDMASNQFSLEPGLSNLNETGKSSNQSVLKVDEAYFEKAKDLRPTLYDEKVIGLGYTPMFLTHSDEALEIEKFKRSKENKIKFAYDYGNLNASYQPSSLKPYVPNVILEKIIIDLEDEVVNLLEKEKVNLETIESLKSKGFESSEKVSSKSENQSINDCLVVEKECDKKENPKSLKSKSFESSEKVCSESENQTKNDCLVFEKECDKEENPKVIAPGMFNLNVSQCVSPISMSKSSCDSNNVEIKLKRKRRKRKSSKQNVKQVDNDVLRANNDFVHFLDLETFSSVRIPRHRDVIWKKKGLSNTSNVGLSAVSV
nr:copia protein [Tanacetum cinerariifolium]